MVALPDDNFLETSPEMEYFCRDSCCHQKEHCAHALDVAEGKPHQKWVASETRALVADLFTFICIKVTFWNLFRYFLVFWGLVRESPVQHQNRTTSETRQATRENGAGGC